MQGCNNSTLTLYVPSSENPWDISKIRFIYRRLGFGISNEKAKALLTKSPEELIDEIINSAKMMPLTPAPEWGFWNNDEINNSGNNQGYYKTLWQKQAFSNFLSDGFRERLTLFWSNHFVTEYYDYNRSQYLYQYHSRLQQYSLGNFKEFLSAIGLEPAMLLYLNGYSNKKKAPNENYARELYELFTLGEGNGYTSSDITETSRALTGYNKYSNGNGSAIIFSENNFDAGEKTIFGKTGNWGYQDVVDILFQEKKELIANFICEKLYKYFVSPILNKKITSELASTFISNNFELVPVYQQLFKSEHFFDLNSSNVLIKSPIDLFVFIQNDFEFVFPQNFQKNHTNYMKARCIEMGQEIFKPIDVAGWQENHDWISTGTIPMRWEFIEYILNRHWAGNKEQFRTFIISLVGQDEKDPKVIVDKLKDYMFCKYDIKEEEQTDAINIFKGDIPDNYFQDGTWTLNYESVPTQVYNLMLFFISLPEFQLK
ncbi:MAG: DUF1800 domain-containing protein [Flavobacteriaceae bacterium]|nr:DUF1800 domain-containing protein [Flavobacteriaceae bacterium]